MSPEIAKWIWAVGCIAWFVLRYPHQRRSHKTPVVRRPGATRDRILLAISFSGLGIIPFIYVVTGEPRAANHSFNPLHGWIGAAVFMLALVLFYETHRMLGRSWSVTLEVREAHKLVMEGIYRYIRHPMYTAFWLWAVAQALLLPNWIAGFAGVVGFGILFAFRIGREEAMMVEAFGDEYRAYQARTKRIIPGIY